MIDANGWTIIITGTLAALFAGLPAIGNFILSLRNRTTLKAQDVKMAVQDGKLDDLHETTNGMSDKLVAVTARSSFQDGVAAQKATQNAEDGQQRRQEDKP